MDGSELCTGVEANETMESRMEPQQDWISQDDRRLPNPDPPQQSWLNQFAKQHGLKLKNSQTIEQMRRLYCDETRI